MIILLDEESWRFNRIEYEQMRNHASNVFMRAIHRNWVTVYAFFVRLDNLISIDYYYYSLDVIFHFELRQLTNPSLFVIWTYWSLSFLIITLIYHTKEIDSRGRITMAWMVSILHSNSHSVQCDVLFSTPNYVHGIHFTVFGLLTLSLLHAESFTLNKFSVALSINRPNVELFFSSCDLTFPHWCKSYKFFTVGFTNTIHMCAWILTVKLLLLDRFIHTHTHFK